MQSIETLLVMNLLVMIILGILVSFKLVASFLMEYLGFKLTMDALKEELQQVRIRGYALDNEECELGHRCVSVPLHDYTGAVVAAVSAFDSADRLTDTEIRSVALPGLQAMAREISFRMGYSG